MLRFLRKFWPYVCVFALGAFLSSRHLDPTFRDCGLFALGAAIAAMLCIGDPLAEAASIPELEREFSKLAAKYDAARAKLQKYL